MYAFTADDAFNAFIYPEKNTGGLQYLKNQFNNFTGVLTGAANDFIQRSREQFELFNSSAAVEFARNIVKSVMHQVDIPTDKILSLWDVNQIQGASIPMQRWVMANPVVRELYHSQGCEGYIDTYVDVQPKIKGPDHYDYRRVMDGVMQYDKDDNWFVKIFVEDLLEGDRDLTHGEKVDIIQTWSKLEYLIALGKDDPTSPDGGFL
jgi:hypothetical protein